MTLRKLLYPPILLAVIFACNCWSQLQPVPAISAPRYNPWAIRVVGAHTMPMSGANPSANASIIVSGEIPAGSLRVQLAFLNSPGDESTVISASTTERVAETVTIFDKYGLPQREIYRPNIAKVTNVSWQAEVFIRRFKVVDTNGWILAHTLGCLRTRSGRDASGTASIRELAFDWPYDESDNRIPASAFGALLLVDTVGKFAAPLAVGGDARACGALRLKEKESYVSGVTNPINPPVIALGSPAARAPNWPAYSRELDGRMEVRVRNPNGFAVKVGLRSAGNGKDFTVRPNGVQIVQVPNGRYEIFFQYSTDPDGLYQGDSFTLNGNGVEIQIVKVINGNYGIRKVR